jgi:hypothetical protein
MKKLFIVVESIDINKSSGAKGRFALIQNLTLLGYKVKVLHYSRKDIELEGAELVEIEEKKFSLFYFLSRFQRVVSRWLKINFSEVLENLFGHSFTFFNDCKSIESCIIKHYNNEDLIITLSHGASFRSHYALLKLPNLHSKWLAYIHDPYPFHYYPRPYNWVEKGYRFKETFFRQVSEKAKYSAFPSNLLKEWMGSYFPNFLNSALIIPHQISERTNEYNLVFNSGVSFFDYTKFNLLHAGNLMKPRNPRGLIAGFKLFLKKHPEATKDSNLLFIGPASYHKIYLMKQLSENIYWSKGGVSFQEVIYLQTNASVNVILESNSEISPFLPGKFPHCVMANKPILHLGPYYSETRNLLGKDYNYTIESDNINEISDKISSLYDNWKKGINQNLNRQDLNDYLSVNNLSNSLKKILDD